VKCEICDELIFLDCDGVCFKCYDEQEGSYERYLEQELDSQESKQNENDNE